MKKFTIKFFILLLSMTVFLLAVTGFDFIIVGNQYSNGYQASLIDKVARLKSISDPKIILVGNSNLSFGIISEMIEEEIKMPVINLGLHGSLGNAFHEEISKLNINKGDIVIICHSTYSDNGNIIDAKLAWATLEKNKELWQIIQKNDYMNMIQAYPRYALNSITLWMKKTGNLSTEAPYSRNSFNAQGDIINRPEETLTVNEKLWGIGSVTVPQINQVTVDRLNKFNMFVKNKSANLVIAGYPIGDGVNTPPVSEYKQFQIELEEKLDCQVISEFTDYFIPYEYFYDTNLHLTKAGAYIRTNKLIQDLKKWIN